MESEEPAQPAPITHKQSWFAVCLGGPWDNDLRKVLTTASRVSSQQEPLPPFVFNELKRRGVVLVPFVQRIN
jgi:hypothetical protein